MAMAGANCSSWFFSTLSFSNGALSSSSLRYLSAPPPSICSFSIKAASNRSNGASRKASSASSGKYSGGEANGTIMRKNLGRLSDEQPLSFTNDSGGRRDAGRSRSAAFGMQKKDKRGILYDMKEQLVETGNLENAAFLNAVLKVYCTHTAPDYSLPWQKQRQFTSTGRRKTAICYKVKVKRRGDDRKYVAKVLARGVDCDLALLSVESEEFWVGAEPLRFGRLSHLQEAVTVVGYPLGGDTISVTKGVVSRVEVTSYAHGSSDLLGIQIDAAINPGNSGGPALNDQGECIGVPFQIRRYREYRICDSYNCCITFSN